MLYHFKLPQVPIRHLTKNYINNKKECHLYRKRGTHAVTRSRFEVFELTRSVETSNEDPTLYVYSTLLSHGRHEIGIYYIPMSIYRCVVFDRSEMFEVSKHQNQASANAFTIM